MHLILIVLLLVLIFGGGWFGNRTWGPSGGYSIAGILLVVVVALFLLGRL